MTTILVADDDELVLQTLAIGIRSAGFSVLVARDGEEALQILEGSQIDLLVTDMMMPEREGIELITHLRREGHALPIIAITGAIAKGFLAGRDDSALYLRTAHLLGATRTLAKPFTPAELVDAIKSCLSAE